MSIVHPIYNLLLQIRTAGLGHDAIIEIMIALVGVMLTILAVIIAVVGWFGYTSIRDEAVKRAELMADKTARKVATSIATQAVQKILQQSEASLLAAAQADDSAPLKSNVKGSGTAAIRRRAVSDSKLREEEG